ncbi:MAG: hypothetical protein HY314_17065 [Acidobacteria bacterium]|nr:hypothetical protein [Acidobacteriota bacterium]
MRTHESQVSVAFLLLVSSFFQLGYSQAEKAKGKADPEIRHTVLSLEAIVACMEQAWARSRARCRPYTVIRDYRLFGKERDKAESQVIAEVSFLPPNYKSYAIRQTNGSGYGAKIIRQVLEKEAQLARDYSSSDISCRNYDFRLIREADVNGHRCYVLELLPKRQDKNLLLGNACVDAKTYLIHRIEGRPVRDPSWWVRDVRVALIYGNVGGMWLQTALEATANIRLLGQYTMVSRDVEYKMKEVAAAKPSVHGDGKSGS